MKTQKEFISLPDGNHLINDKIHTVENGIITEIKEPICLNDIPEINSFIEYLFKLVNKIDN